MIVIKNTMDNKIYEGQSYYNVKLTKIIFAITFTFLIAISANIFIYIPVTPVPLTVQTMTVLLAAILLGKKYAFLSTSLYIIAGLAGLPVFAGLKSGITVIAGPTGGYIIGFLASSYITASIYEKFSGSKKVKLFSAFLSCITGLFCIYLFGYIHIFGLILTSSIRMNPGNIFVYAFDLAVKPFILIDIIKILLIADTSVLLNKKDNR